MSNFSLTYLAPSLYNRAQSNARYGLSVMAIFRNEAHAIKEWVEHYQMFGTEHFYLIDNHSTDSYMEHLMPYVVEGTVDLFHCEKDNFQIGAYAELLPKITAEAEWIGVFDLDEFVYPPAGGQITDVLDRLSSYECILIPWLSFGSSGHVKQPSSIIDGFIRRGDAAVSRAMLKAISRPGAITTMSQHNPTTRRRSKVLANGAEWGDEHFMRLDESAVCDFWLINNHYRTQSEEHFRAVKAPRLEVNEKVAERSKTMKFFWTYDFFWNGVPDRRLADIRATRHEAVACSRQVLDANLWRANWP